MSLLQSIPFVFIALLIHEAWGHKLIAEKVLGLKPLFIAIGMPLKIGKFTTVFYTWNRPGKVPVVFSWLLIGGGVAFDDKAYYSVGNYWKKILMVLAGPAVNILASILLVSVFTNPVMGISLVLSYAGLTTELIRAIFTTMTIEQAFASYYFFELTVKLAQMTAYWLPLAYFTLWNVSLAIVNLFSVPGLDGGQIIGLSYINLVGVGAIEPVKVTNEFFYYVLIGLSTLSLLWWILTIFI